MKRFLSISILLSILANGKTRACISEAPTYNYYMMHVCPNTSGMFYERTNLFWKAYSNGKCDSYDSYNPTVREVATKKGDREMLAYMDVLDQYLKICDQLKETWSYPTAEELTRRKATLQQMTAKAKAYKGTRLKPQYALLLMRAQMLLGQHNANLQYWTTQASKMSPDVYRDMMENIYANALLNTGKRQAACDIYVTQGDWESLRWMTHKHRNLAGIKALYAQNPNSPTLTYLVEDFVNNVQETLDLTNAAESKKDLFGDFNEEWIETVGRKPIYNKEANLFVTFAQHVLKEGKTHTPCLWQTAIGAIAYLNGDAPKALALMDKAVGMKGTEQTKDNARCIRLICAASANRLSQKYEQFLTEELKWLDSRIDDKALTATDSRDDAGYYLRMKERLIHRTLIPKYRAEGRFETAAYMLDMIERQSIGRYELQEDDEYYWNREYSSYYFGCLDRLSADSLVLYKTRLDAAPAGDFERYLKTHVYRNEAYYNDLIGTKLIAEGRFDEAIPYLKKVPLAFLRKQNICDYMAARDYRIPKWFTRQIMKEESFGHRDWLTKNPKLEFCREMLQLLSQHDLARTNSKERLSIAYELGVRYFQASCYGDCWYLTHYAQSVADSARVGEKDFALAAVEYLGESKLSNDFTMKQQSLYALAYIPTEPYMVEIYDPKTYSIKWSISKSRQFFALQELNDFAISHPGKIGRYVSSCDVLRTFRTSLP